MSLLFSPIMSKAPSSPLHSDTTQQQQPQQQLINNTPMVTIGSATPILQRAQQHQQYHRHHHHDELLSSSSSSNMRHLYVLPVLLLEFLAIALTRAVLPSLLLQKYGNAVYLVMGAADCVRGLLAFVACPLFGRVSDVIGRRICLFVTVLGTCAPVCSLAFFSWENSTDLLVVEEEEPFLLQDVSSTEISESASTSKEASDEAGIWPMILDNTSGSSSSSSTESWAQTDALPPHPEAITVFVVLLALSGIFSSTFTLVFAYISDTVKQQDERVSAYGLALATFGLSFTIGPMAGGYLAQYNKQYVFLTSLFLTVVDLLYIYLFLPESRIQQQQQQQQTDGSTDDAAISGTASLITLDHNFSWNPWDTFQLIVLDPFLQMVGKVAFLYYTGLWALISTLSVYAVKRFHLGPERLGELMSALGLCTMVAEAVLVRIVVPLLGEKRAMKVGLVSFAIQCVVLGFAYEGWHLFVCAIFSLLGNLVYPSLSSLVSGSVEPDAVGEALGAINGIKALTEGIGPLFFGSLMTLSEHSALPGWPYLLAALLVIAAYKVADGLPDVDEDDYIHELEQKRRRQRSGEENGILMRTFSSRTTGNKGDEEEYEGLLSEIDESDEEVQ